MTLVTGTAIDPESGAPLSGRTVYATVEPRNGPTGPLDPPGGRDRAVTDNDGKWTLNLRRTAGYQSHYVIRVWLSETLVIDVPDGPGPYDVNTLIATPGVPGATPMPPNWTPPAYIPVADKGVPSGVATLDANGKLTASQRPPSSGTGEPGEPSGPLSYRHEQNAPSTIWLISHGLAFTPSGIEVFDHLGSRHHPAITFLDGGVRLQFDADVRGVAYLS